MKNHTIHAMGATTEASCLAENLVEAYLKTAYGVHASDVAGSFALRIGEPSDVLRALMTRFNRASTAYITACNPFGEALSAQDNLARHQRLGQELAHRSLPHWPGIGEGPDGAWPGEDSFLVLGLDLVAAQRLGQAFEQNALVWAGSDAVPKLVLLR
ncbi:MAG: DUF3293 domain-containing protein [Acidovorax sp.]|jgi:hypothetical protein|nr:DUF3293 domain-containing protein [Acidovorax sp.]